MSNKYKRKNKNNTCLIDILVDIKAYKYFKNIKKWEEFYNKEESISFKEFLELLDFNKIDFFISLPIDINECTVNCLINFIKNINKNNIHWIYVGYTLYDGHAFLYLKDKNIFIDNKNIKLTDKINKKFYLGNLIGISFVNE